MGYTTSTIHGIEVPDSPEPNNIPEDIGKVVTALEGGSIVRRLTGAAIAALTAPQKPAGLVVYNTTTGKLQISDGTNFSDVGADLYAVGTRTSTVTLSDNVQWTVTYTAETDPSAMLNTSTGVLTVPVAGVWHVSGSVQVDNLAGGNGEICQLEVMHGSQVAAKTTLTGTDWAGVSVATLGLSSSALVVAAASDEISLRLLARVASGMSHTAQAARFSAHLVSR